MLWTHPQDRASYALQVKSRGMDDLDAREVLHNAASYVTLEAAQIVMTTRDKQKLKDLAKAREILDEAWFKVTTLKPSVCALAREREENFLKEKTK